VPSARGGRGAQEHRLSRSFSLVPSQQMRLEQRLTPQIIQSMEILQLPLPALEARIREELASNPVLEELEPEAPAKPIEGEPPASPPAAEKPASQKEAEAFEQLEKISREYELDPGDVPYGRGQRAAGERDAKMDAMAATPSRAISLQEHLALQWALVEAPPEIKRAGSVLIDMMDPDGYLRTEAERSATGQGAEGAGSLIIRRDEEGVRALMEEIAHSESPPIPEHVLEDALWLVQTLEPLGVGARDLTECLMIQLDAIPDAPPLAGRLVEEHLLDIAKNRMPAIAKATGQSIEEIREALGVISRLHHHPGLLISAAEVPVIAPDIVVDYADDEDGYSVRLTKGNHPRLRISEQYRRMLEERREDKSARDFIRKHLESATNLIEAIQYRRERLLQLARVIVERQREFFDYGPQHLKVLRMRDLAAEFGCDPSTISRTVDEKYMQTPRGILPMRTFFSGGTETDEGESVSWDSVKAQVREIIDKEDKHNPLNDDQIVARMAEQGVHISRRTVAKYRAVLNIPAARQRQAF